MNHLTRLALACAVALPMGAAMAQAVAPVTTDADQAMRHRAKQLERLDTDGDGRLSRAEAAGRGGIMHNFDTIDANRDGYLDRTELQQWAASHPVTHGKVGKGREGRAFQKADANNDGVITADEAARMGKGGKAFQQADADGDGKVTPQEAQAWRKSHRHAKPRPAPTEPAPQPLMPSVPASGQ